ncbi:MAG: hypothetical protein R3Y53_11240 [Bacillota bacterium]
MIFVFWVCCNICCELGQAIFMMYRSEKNGYALNFTKLHFTPIGVRMDGRLPQFSKKAYEHVFGTLIGFLLAVWWFAWEERGFAYVSLAVAVVRLLPILPFEGGKIIMILGGKLKGTVHVAIVLTKIGIGCGYAICIFGAVLSVFSPIGFFILLWGVYLLHYNQKALSPLTKTVYENLVISGDKPFREIVVRGDESPFELSFYLNPYEEIIFSAKGKQGVSQQKVIVGLLEEKDAEWLWQSGKRFCE